MVVSAHAGRLLGRQRERAVLEWLLDTARNARGAVLVVHGDPGVGKTALLEYAVEAGRIFASFGLPASRGRWSSTTRRCNSSVRRSSSSASVSPILSVTRSASLRIQRRTGAESVPVGSRFSASSPKPLMAAAAVRGRRRAVARRRIGPRSRSWLAACWRRGSRSHSRRDVGTGLARFPELRVDPLGRRDARVLLESALAARLDESVLDRIVAETGGNRRAPGTPARADSRPARRWLRTAGGAAFVHWDRAELRAAPARPLGTRRLLLLAAAEPVGDLGLLWRAAQQLGIPRPRARRGGGRLVDVGRCGGVPASARALAQCTVRPSRTSGARSATALADATDPQLDPDRRAWHRAQAAPVPDEELAGELERSAGRAQARGGLAAAAASRGRRDADPRTVATRTPRPRRSL